MKIGTCIYLGLVVYLMVVNVWAYTLFGKDKHKAKANGHRVSERHLMCSVWLGGGLGAWLAMRRFRHKTQHARFKWGVPIVMLLWLLPVGSTTLVFMTQWGHILFTPLMVRRVVASFSEDTPYKTDYRWVDYECIAPSLTRAVIASEDNLFAQHHGFSQEGIKKAIQERREKGKVRHGGSTISQQTAKNVFTGGYRTVFRKARETWYTVLIETFWGKERIMEVYLNVMETGDGIFGAEAAAQRYFHHSAQHLSNAEAALITACLPSPRKYSVVHPGPYVRKRQGQILNLMPKIGPIDLSEAPQKDNKDNKHTKNNKRKH